MPEHDMHAYRKHYTKLKKDYSRKSKAELANRVHLGSPLQIEKLQPRGPLFGLQLTKEVLPSISRVSSSNAPGIILGSKKCTKFEKSFLKQFVRSAASVDAAVGH